MTVKKPLVINQPEVGKLIHELRLSTGLTQEQFAAELGVTYPMVNRWERGRFKPSPMAMQRIELLLHSLGDQGKDLLAKYSLAVSSADMRWRSAFRDRSNESRFPQIW